MRDTRKDSAYYEKYLDYQYSRIEKKIVKLKDSDEEKKQRILVSLTGYEIDLLKAEFSVGASKDNIRVLLNRAIKIASDYKNISYEDLLILMSLAVMVNDKSEVINLIKNNEEKIKMDRLLNYISYYIQGEKPRWNKMLKLGIEYSGLDKVFTESEKEVALLEYLDEWYESHSGYAWYDSHKSSLDTYCGYWSFESAAISIIIGGDDEKLRDSVYYPFF